MRLRQRLTSLLALLVLAGILAGLPLLLLQVGGNPLPTAVPSPGQVRDALLTPDDGTLALAAAQLLGWAVWAALAVTILLELVAQLRGLHAPTLPALPQTTVRRLVSACLALFITTPLTPAAPHAPPAQAVTVSGPTSEALTTQTATAPAAPPVDDALARDTLAAAAPVATRTYTVRPGDTLWGIAAEQLGSGQEFTRLVELNRDVLTDGPDWITPGARLRLPADPSADPGQAGITRHLVVEGDTLSALAQTHLGAAEQWPQIYEASAHNRQPGGARLTDPDLIHPGWTLHIPDGEPTTAAPPALGEPDSDDAGIVRQTATLTGHAVTAADAGSRLGTIPAPGDGHGGSHPEAAAAAVPENVTTRPAPVPTTTAPAPDFPERPTEVQNQIDQEPAAVPDAAGPDWVLEGLAGAGALLAGAAFLVLRSRRRAQFRHRRPGRTIAPPPPQLAPVEKTLQTLGAQAAPTLTDLDDLLRRLGAACSAAEAGVPALAAAELRTAALVLHLSEPASLAAPWSGSADQLHWNLPLDADHDAVGPCVPDQPAPYPLLVTIGTADDGAVWLLNLEDLQVSITGPQEYARDLARYLAAEIAVNPWSTGARLDCVGIAHEVVPMNPARLRAGDEHSAAGFLAHALDTAARLPTSSDTATARAAQSHDDTWPARLLMVDGDLTTAAPALPDLAEALRTHACRTGVGVVVRAEATTPTHAVALVVTGEGRLRLPSVGLDLVAVGLTADEARGCAALLAQGQDLQDVPVPARPATEEEETGWRTWVDETGAVRRQHTTPRPDTPGVGQASLLDGVDEDYLTAAATTQADLDTLAPGVEEDAAMALLDADPTLDEDVALWWDQQCPLPRLSLLGPVIARTRGKPLVDRKPYFTELLAYLALHPHGATPEEAAEAFGISTAKCRDYMRRLREWLGTNPRTGQPHLPNADQAPAAQTRGRNLYQVLDVLCDVDLFRRLRARGQARGGQAGMADLRQALRLVQGRPFDQLRPGGWAWLFEGDRTDQHMVCGIVDVAHLVVVHDLEAGNVTGARLAAEVAALAAPQEEIPTLDLAAVAYAQGHHHEAVRLLQTRVCDRVDGEEDLPGELPERTRTILARHGWLDREAG